MFESDLFIVVVNYFSSNQTLDLIRQVQTQEALPEYKVICADNSCDRNEVKNLEQAQAELGFALQINAENLGYGAAINRALSNQSFKRALILNPDVSLQRDTITNLYEQSLVRPSQGIWGGLTIMDSGQQDFRHAWRNPSVTRNIAWALGLRQWLIQPLFSDNYRQTYKQSPYSVDIVSGCCMMISGETWQQLSGFDEAFFLYSEEVDLCYRSKKLGYQPTVIPSAKLAHKKPGKAEALDKLVMIYKGKMIFAEKHFTSLYACIYRYSLLLGALIRALAYGYVFRDKLTAKVWRKVSGDLFLNRRIY